MSTVLHAYNEHLTLRTGPDDWWATIITTVSLAIDDNAKEDEVRQFFVAHEGKKTLSVRVINKFFCIFQTNFDIFFFLYWGIPIFQIFLDYTLQPRWHWDSMVAIATPLFEKKTL